MPADLQLVQRNRFVGQDGDGTFFCRACGAAGFASPMSVVAHRKGCDEDLPDLDPPASSTRNGARTIPSENGGDSSQSDQVAPSAFAAVQQGQATSSGSQVVNQDVLALRREVQDMQQTLQHLVQQENHRPHQQQAAPSISLQGWHLPVGLGLLGAFVGWWVHEDEDDRRRFIETLKWGGAAFAIGFTFTASVDERAPQLSKEIATAFAKGLY